MAASEMLDRFSSEVMRDAFEGSGGDVVFEVGGAFIGVRLRVNCLSFGRGCADGSRRLQPAKNL
jgi:hypothetical protein